MLLLQCDLLLMKCTTSYIFHLLIIKANFAFLRIAIIIWPKNGTKTYV